MESTQIIINIIAIVGLIAVCVGFYKTLTESLEINEDEDGK